VETQVTNDSRDRFNRAVGRKLALRKLLAATVPTHTDEQKDELGEEVRMFSREFCRQVWDQYLERCSF
jgi:hypothetical protein